MLTVNTENSGVIKNTKKKYRGKGKVNSRNSTFTVLLTNLRGYKTKEVSLKKIIRKVKPSVIVMNETQMVGNMKVSLEPYTSWTKNRTEKTGGGIATAVSPQYSDQVVGAGEGEDNNEYMITRFEAFYPALNIVNNYGEQRKTNKKEIEDKWSKLRKALEDIRIRGEYASLIGDLNKLVGCDQWGVPGNNPEISPGGGC